MKKNLQIFLIFILMVGLVACNANNTKTKENKTSEESTQNESTQKENGQNESKQNEASGEGEKQNQAKSNFVPIPVFDKSSTIQEKVLYDSNGVTISSKKLKFGDYYAELVLGFKNTTETNLKFFTGTIVHRKNSLNEFMNNMYMNVEVPANGTAEDTIKIGYDELVFKGIDSIAEMVLDFWIEPVKFGDKTFERTTTGPLVIKTSSYDKYDFGNNNRLKDRLTNKALYSKHGTTFLGYSSEPIYDSNNILISSNYQFKNSRGDKSLILEIVNNNDFMVDAMIKNLYINDKLVTEGYWVDSVITSNKRDVFSLSLERMIKYNKEIDLKLSDIKTVKFTLKVTNEDGNEVNEPKEIIINIK